MNLTERHAQRDESAGMVVDARRLTDLRRVHTRRLPIYRPIPGARGCGRPGASGLLCLRKAPRRQRSSSDGPVAETAHSCRSSYFEEVASAATTKTAIAVPSTAALPEEPSGGTARRAMNGSRSSNSDRVTVPVLRCCMTARVQNVCRIQPDACLTYFFAQPFVRRIVVHPTVPLLSVRRSRCESPDRSRGTPAAVPSLIRITKVRRSSRDRSTGLAPTMPLETGMHPVQLTGANTSRRNQAECRKPKPDHTQLDTCFGTHRRKGNTRNVAPPIHRPPHEEACTRKSACRRRSFPDNPCREYRHRERSGPRASGLEHRRSFRRHESGEGVSFRFLGYRPRIGSRRVQDRRSVRLGRDRAGLVRLLRSRSMGLCTSGRFDSANQLRPGGWRHSSFPGRSTAG